MAEPMEEEIKTALRTAVARAYQDTGLETPGWTKAIVEALLKCGHDHGYKVCCSHPEGDHPEWLYDLLWYHSDGTDEHERLRDVPMVMECEWHTATNKMSEDFEKLLVANAPLKVFVCCPPITSREHWMDYFTDSIQNYVQRRKDDRFVIGFLRDTSKDIWFETITVE